MCCVCTASFPRRDRAHPRRNVLCPHSIVSTTRLRSPAQKRTVSAQHRFHDETALTRAETYCVCSIFSTDETALACAETYCVCTASSQPTKPHSPAQSVLCLHSIFSTDETAPTAPKCAVFTASSRRRDRVHPHTAYCVCSCLHSILSTTRPRSPAQSVPCLHSILSSDERHTRQQSSSNRISSR